MHDHVNTNYTKEFAFWKIDQSMFQKHQVAANNFIFEQGMWGNINS